MKTNIAFISILLVGFLFYGCEKVDELTQFQISYNVQTTVPATTVTNVPLDITTPDYPTNSESQFSGNGTNQDLIERIELRDMTISVVSPDSGDLGFLKEIYIYMNADGLSEQLLASEENIPEDVGSSISLTTTSSDLKEYIKKQSFRIRFNVLTDEAIATDHELNIYTNYFVDAKILGQ